MSTYSGTLIAELLKIGIDTTDNYTAEELCDCLMADVKLLPPCAICERPAAVKICKSCDLRFCVNGCYRAHDCCQVDGLSTDPLRG